MGASKNLKNDRVLYLGLKLTIHVIKSQILSRETSPLNYDLFPGGARDTVEVPRGPSSQDGDLPLPL